MSAPALKGYQEDAVNNALEIYRFAEGQLRKVNQPHDRLAVTAHNGCVLLEAPTGSGKTLMAGNIAESLSAQDNDQNARVVWFWFTHLPVWLNRPKGRSNRPLPVCGYATWSVTVSHVVRVAAMFMSPRGLLSLQPTKIHAGCAVVVNGFCRWMI